MNKEPLVLLPGLLCDDAVWVQQRDALAHRAEAYVPDYGLLSSIEGMARKVLADAPFKTFSLAGHSMGGRVALEVLRLAPERVRRLALLDTGYEPIAAGEAGAQEREKRMKLLAHARAHGMREMGKLWAPGMVHPDRVQSPLFEEILQMIERRTPDQFAAQIDALLGRPDAGPVLRAIKCPTYLICGRQDAWSPYARHETMSHMIPSQWVHLHAVEDSGHMSTMEQPQAVTQLFEAWLDTPATIKE